MALERYHPHPTLWLVSWVGGGPGSPLHLTRRDPRSLTGVSGVRGDSRVTCNSECMRLKPWRLNHVKQRARIPTTHDVSKTSTRLRGPLHPLGALSHKKITRGSVIAHFYPSTYVGFLIFLSCACLCHWHWYLWHQWCALDCFYGCYT